MHKSPAGNLTQNQTPKTNTRKYSDLSPEEKEIESKKVCQEMEQTDLELKEFMKEIKEQMTMMNQQINEISLKFDTRFEAITEDINQVKKDLVDARADVLKIEEENAAMKAKLISHEHQLNVLNQKSMEKQLTMINIASTLNEEKFLDDMNKWSNNIIHETLSSHNFSSNDKFSSKSAHLNFKSIDAKKKFLKFVSSKQRDSQKKFIPILNENVFTLNETDINRPNQIDFRTPMTATNREAFNLARKARNKNEAIEGVWISNGSIKIRIKKMKPIQIVDTEHLKEVLSSNNIEIPQN